MLVIIFAGITVAAALLCLQRAFMVNEGDPAAVEEVVQCAPCDAFRFGLFATAAFVLLMLIGQGQSATETVGRQLGLIQSDVTAIRRSEEHTSELQSLMRISYAVFCLKTKNTQNRQYD